MKTCCRCNTEKEEAAFSKNLTSKNGVGSWCQVCLSEYNKLRRNTPIVRETLKVYAKSNRATISRSDIICAVCHRKRTEARRVRRPEALAPTRSEAWHPLAGTMSDYDLAKQSLVSKSRILYYRRKMGIPAFNQVFGRRV